MEEDRLLLVCGDIHGALKTLVYNIKEQKKLSHVDVIVAGDFGVGFGGPNSMDSLHAHVLPSLVEKDINIYAVRGNHDDPQWFDGKHNMERLFFLEDHKVHEIAGKRIYVVGGGISVDIDRKDAKGMSRRDYNNRYIRFGSRKRCYWENEGIIEKKEDLPIKVDIIITHEAPINFDPVPMRPEDVTYETWQKVLSGRTYLSYLTSEIKVGRWYYGHHHHHYGGSYGDILYTGLDIMELCEVY